MLVLIQKTISPTAESVVQALGTARIRVECSLSGTPMPEEVPGSEDFILWDLSGFEPSESQEVAQELAKRQCGLLVLAPCLDQTCQAVTRQAQAMGLVMAPPQPGSLAQALDLAQTTFARIVKLRMERDRLRQEFADRLLIDEAKRLLMRQKRLTEAEALRRMQRFSRDTNQKLALVAKRILAGYQILGGNQSRS
ncbi:MAG: ANTAR domain-containing protein [Desulfarculaceae bacterium]